MWARISNRIALEFYKTAKIATVPREVTAVMASLYSGQINAVTASPYIIVGLQWHDKFKYMTNLRVSAGVGAMVIIKQKFDELSAAQQKALRETASAYQSELIHGQAAPLNLEYQRQGRVLPFPFHFLSGSHAMNLKPKNYTWEQFYEYGTDLIQDSFSWGTIFRRYKAMEGFLPRSLAVIRGISIIERVKLYREIRRRLDEDPQFRPFFEGETTEIPEFYVNQMRKDLGPLWKWLPDGALYHARTPISRHRRTP